MKFGLIWSYILKFMNFLFLGIFSRFFLNYFQFLMTKIIKKRLKRGVFLRGTHVDATWHARQRCSTTRPYAAM